MFDPRSCEKSERKKKATQEEAAWRSRRAVEFGHQTVDMLRADSIFQCWHTSFSLTIRNKHEICISKWYAGPHDSVLVSQYAVKFNKEFTHSYFIFITFIASDFFTTTNRIGYTKILSSDFKGERCTVLKSLGNIDYPEVFVVFLSPSTQISGWRFRLCHNTHSFLLILLLNTLCR